MYEVSFWPISAKADHADADAARDAPYKTRAPRPGRDAADHAAAGGAPRCSLVATIGDDVDSISVTVHVPSSTLTVSLRGVTIGAHDVIATGKPEGGIVADSWNLLRVLREEERVRVWCVRVDPPVYHRRSPLAPTTATCRRRAGSTRSSRMSPAAPSRRPTKPHPSCQCHRASTCTSAATARARPPRPALRAAPRRVRAVWSSGRRAATSGSTTRRCCRPHSTGSPRAIQSCIVAYSS